MIKAKCCGFVLGALLFASLPSSVWARQGIRWQPALETAKRTAAQTNRLVLVHFWAEWCKPCAQMERDVFGRPDVAAAIEAAFVPVKVNVDQFPATVREYGVSIVPTDVVMTADGQLVDKLIGLADASQYVARLNQIAQGRAPQSRNGYSQVASSGPPAAGAYQQPAPGGYQNPGYQTPEQPQPDDRYSNTFNQQSRPEPSPVGQPYANPWPPTTTIPSSDVAARQPPSYQAPTSPYASQTASPYQDPVASSYGRGSDSPYSPDAASPYQNAASSPYQGAAPSYQSGVTSSQPDAGGPSYQGSTTSPYQSGVSPPDARVSTVPYQTSTPSYQQQPAADRPWQAPSSQTSPSAVLREEASPGADSRLAEQIPAGSPPLALDGFCPVRLTEQERWVRGDVRWGARHEGRTYLFAGPEEQQRFLASPQKYAPVLAGNDVVIAAEQGQIVPGRREFGAWYHGNVYLFAGEASYQRFNTNPEQYVRSLRQNAGQMAQRPSVSPAAGSSWQTYGPAVGGRY